MSSFPPLQAGDVVEIIAPASRSSLQYLHALRELLLSWNLHCVLSPDLFGDDLLCANSDEHRLRLLKQALLRPESKALICLRGGYGSMRLIPGLSQMPAPTTPKILVGMSDITALHLFIGQVWGWPSIHASANQDKCLPACIEQLRSLLFADSPALHLTAQPLNAKAAESFTLESSIVGGNLSLVQCSIGSLWQMQAKNKVVFLEDVGERGYRIDRMLEHLKQAGLFKDAAAILLGDFNEGTEPDGSSLVAPVLKRFADTCCCPVIQISNVGHGLNNTPFLFGCLVRVKGGAVVDLIW
jgi:muramoyltetrapeptide carboxypeptidase